MKRKLSILMLLSAVLTMMVSVSFAYGMEDAAAELFKNCKGKWASAYVVTYDDASLAAADGYTSDEIVGANGTRCSCGKLHFVSKNTTVENFISKAQAQSKTTGVTNQVGDIQDNLGVNANTDDAMTLLAGFVPLINIGLGVVVVLITLGLAVFTAFDVCYIVFPVFRGNCEKAKASGEGFMAKRDNATGGTKLRFVSDEAQFVVENCSVSQGKNPLTAYLGKRVGSYIAVTIVLTILLSGNITIITNIALKIVSYVMELLAKLG